MQDFWKHWRVLTICRASDMSWVYFTTRWKKTDPKGWLQWNTIIGPALEVTTSYVQGKHGVEVRIESVITDNSHLWVRISHDLNKLVTDLNDRKYDDDDHETSETKTEVFAFASRSKTKAKPRILSLIFKEYLFLKECGLILNLELNSLSLPSGEKKYTLLFDTENYFERKMERSNSGDWKMIFRIKLNNLNIDVMMYGRARWHETEATRKDFNTVLFRRDKKLFFSGFFKVNSGRNPIDPSLQDSLLIPHNFFE